MSRIFESSRGAAVLLISIGLLAPLPHALATPVDLEFNPIIQQSIVGNQVTIQIIARSSASQCINGMDMILIWDPTYLQLTGTSQAGAGYNWLIAGFLPDPDGLNTDITDGEALFTALASPGSPAFAVPGGLVVTTLLFDAVAPTAGTTVEFAATRGAFGRTQVLCGGNVTGDISSVATVSILPCIFGDSNCDGVVNNFDIDCFVTAIVDPPGWTTACQQNGCDFLCVNDVNQDSAVNNFDIDPFVTCVVNLGCP